MLITVIGRGHSGTRAISQTLGGSGAFMGNRVKRTGDLIPPTAMYEAARIFARQPRWLGGTEWEWPDIGTIPIPDEFTAAVQTYLAGTLASEAERRGWKLPETTLCCPWIARMFPEIR